MTPSPDPSEIQPTTGKGSRPPMPRWVKVTLIIVVLLGVGFIVANAVGGGGDHGPDLHGSEPALTDGTDADGLQAQGAAERER